MDMNIALDNFGLDYLKQATSLVDGNLDKLHLKIKESDMPDELGYFDEVEYITGFGFVACQTYITTIASNFSRKKK